MAVEGVDYSWARPSPTGLYAAGKRFACRYVSSSTRVINGVTKNLSKAEADALHAAGVATVTNWEWTEDDWTHGYATGQEYARRAGQMHADCGGPGGRPIYFSVDRDLGSYPAASVDACRQYFAGIRSVLGKARVGIYGGRYAVRLAHDEGWCDWFWQTYAWSNITTLGWLPYTHIQQYNNGETVAGTPNIDLDRAMVADYGQWGVEDMATPAEVWDYEISSAALEMPPTKARDWLKQGLAALREAKAINAELDTVRAAQAAQKAQLDQVLAAIAAGLTPEQLNAVRSAAAAGATAGAYTGVDKALDGATITTTIDVAEPTP